MQTAVIRKKPATALVASLGIVIAATAFDAQAQVIVRGGLSCGAWVQDRKEDGWPSRASERWIVGFLSGMAYMSNRDVLKGSDNPSIFLWLDNYCQANPLKSVVDGAEMLFLELTKQKKL